MAVRVRTPQQRNTPATKVILRFPTERPRAALFARPDHGVQALAKGENLVVGAQATSSIADRD
jgi:hypothetical protein